MKTDGIIDKDIFSAIQAFTKKALLNTGRSILVILGIVQIVSVVWEAFEKSLSFLEISTLEIIFFVVLFFMVKKYYERSINNRLEWKRMLYVIVSSMGWLLLAIILIVIFAAIVMANVTEWSDFNNFILAHDKAIQIVEYIAVLVTIHLITPKKRFHDEASGQPGSGGQGS